MTHNIETFFLELLNYCLNFMYQISGSNARVGHRNRLNIFDVVKLAGVLQISPAELKAFLKWSQSPEGRRFNQTIFRGSTRTKECYAVSPCKPELVFSLDVNEAKRPGFDYFPPLPSAFTFKSTPIYGKREEEALTILKRRTQEKLKVESNLYEGIKGKRLERIINYDDI